MIDFDWEEFLDDLGRIAAFNTLPEVQKYALVMQSIYADYLNSTAASEESN